MGLLLGLPLSLQARKALWKEFECAKVGFPKHQPLTRVSGTVLKEVKDFKYLGAWLISAEQDL